ncbi:MAG: SigE family RNA polymerase sigma factor [Acidimicrobiales bacterium]
MENLTSEGQFNQFFDGARRKLVGQAYLLTGDFQEAQDLVQEVLLRVWQRWDRVSTLEDPHSWAQHVLHNLAVSHWRHQRLRQVPLGATGPAHGAPPGVGHLDVIAAVSALPPNQRSALVLQAVGGMSTSEIATELKTSADTVRVWLSRARAAVAFALEDETVVTKGGDPNATSR